VSLFDLDKQHDQNVHVHFVGIGGAGLSAIARVLMARGYQVSGCDQSASDLTAALAAEGATVYEGHSVEHIANAHDALVLVISSAVPPDNVEVRAAQARGIPIFKRSDFLGAMMAGRTAVAIAGTHGKTTTSGMMATMFLTAGQDPTFIVGGEIAHLETNARAGNGPFVIEADEYDQTFLGLRPTIAVVTNVEHDHPDSYPTLDDVRTAFRNFVHLLPQDGMLVAGIDDPGAKALTQLDAPWAVVTYGLSEEADWQAANVQPNGAGGSDYVALHRGDSQGLVRLRIPGTHNVVNSLAVLAVGDHLGVPFATMAQAFRTFRGIARRFEIKGTVNGVTVVDDYAHHPTEIKATLAGARDNYPGRRIWAVWQPHTFSRTRVFLDEFAGAFADADQVLVTPIYAARERAGQGIQHTDVAARIQHRHVQAVQDLEQAAAHLATGVRPNDVVLTLGAGDVNRVGDELLQRLKQEPRQA
jgi:UDP-N-acetylmuramate--alanine ligase